VNASLKAGQGRNWLACVSRDSYAKWKIEVDVKWAGHYNARAFERMCPIHQQRW